MVMVGAPAGRRLVLNLSMVTTVGQLNQRLATEYGPGVVRLVMRGGMAIRPDWRPLDVEFLGQGMEVMMDAE